MVLRQTGNLNMHTSISSNMANYEALKASVAKNGEVNVRFEDSTKEIVVDAATETYWIGADRVCYYWIHREGITKE
jgi:hypothetical protein